MATLLQRDEREDVLYGLALTYSTWDVAHKGGAIDYFIISPEPQKREYDTCTE